MRGLRSLRVSAKPSLRADGTGRELARSPTGELAADRGKIRHSLLNDGLKLGEGIDSAGKPLAWTLDCREVVLSSDRLSSVGRLLWERIRPYAPDAVGGLTMSADPLTAAVLSQAGTDGHSLGGFTIRKERKSYGLRKLIEGPSIGVGSRVVVVDDLISSGTSLRRAIAALEPCRSQIVAVAVLVDFGNPKGARQLSELGVPYEAVFTLKEIGLAESEPSGELDVHLAWRRRSLNGGSYRAPFSKPAIVQDGLVVGSDRGYVTRLAHDGGERWRFPVRNTELGVHASPLLHEGKAYFGAYDGFVYCVDAASGTLVWESRCGDWIGSSAAIGPSGDLIYVGTKFGNDGGSLIALGTEDGAIAWTMPASGYVHSSPAVDAIRGQVVVGSHDGHLHAADALTGSRRWAFSTGGPIRGNAVVDEMHCYSGSDDGFLYAIEAEGGDLVWRCRLSRTLYTTPLLHGEMVIAGGFRQLVALERLTGEIRWITTLRGDVIGGAAALSPSVGVVGTTDGYLYFVEFGAGRVVGRIRTAGAIRGTPTTAPGFVAVPSGDGDLYALSCTARTT